MKLLKVEGARAPVPHSWRATGYCLLVLLINFGQVVHSCAVNRTSSVHHVLEFWFQVVWQRQGGTADGQIWGTLTPPAQLNNCPQKWRAV